MRDPTETELTMTESELAALLRNLRDASGQNRCELARSLGVTEGTIRRRERGRALIDAVAVLRHLEALGCRLRVQQGDDAEGRRRATRAA